MIEYCAAHGKPQPDFHIYYMSLKQNHGYHPKRRAGLLSCHHAHPATYMCYPSMMETQIKPCMRLMAEVCHAYWHKIICWEDRCTGLLGLYNHVAHFDTVHTNIVDGFPYGCWKPTDWESEVAKGGLGAELLLSGKYNSACYKGHLWMAFHGLPLGVELCLGVPHDMGIMGETGHRYPMRLREWGMGDLAYGGAERYTVGVKSSAGHAVTKLDVYWTALVGFYRARVEQVLCCNFSCT